MASIPKVSVPTVSADEVLNAASRYTQAISGRLQSLTNSEHDAFVSADELMVYQQALHLLSMVFSQHTGAVKKPDND